MESQKPDNNSGSSAIVPPKPVNSAAKFYAVIVALVIIAAAFGVLYATKSPSSTKTSAVSATLGNVTQTLSVGSTYSFTIKATGSFNSITVWWGDGSSNVIKYANSTTVVASHTYNSQGDYFILYQINYPSSTYNGLIPLSVGYPASSNAFVNLSYGFSQLVANSTPPVLTNPAIFGPGANLTYQVSYSTPSNPSYMVVNVTVNIYKGASLISSNAYPLVYTSAQGGGFILPEGTIDLYLNNLAQGYYTVQSYVTVGTLATTTVTAPVTNTSTVHYSAGSTAYYNQTSYQLSNKSLVNSTPQLALLKGTEVQNYKYTNLTYESGTNVSYAAPSTFMYGNNSALVLTKNAKLTFDTATNVTLASATNVTYGSSIVVHTLSAKTYAMSAGNVTNFLNATALTIDNASEVQLALGSGSVNYSSGQSLEYLTSSTATYNENTSLMYNNVTNWATYPNGAKVGLTTTVEASTTVNTGAADVANVTAQTTVSYTDIPIFDTVTPYSQSASSTFFDSLPNAVGGYTTLDPAISFYTASNEILTNTLLQLDQYNGTSTTSFIPELAQYLPTVANGGVNNNTYSYTYNNAYMGPVTVHVQPGQNFTYHIRNSIRDQFGNAISAYDVYFEIVRDMLFSVSSPGTGGYLIAEYFFVNYSSPGFTPTYQGIMPNLSYNNATDNFTIHFAKPMPTTLVYQLFAASGTFVESATWLTQHGSGITFTPAGFNAYIAEGSSSGYNSYVQNHIDANGPYEISLVSPAQFVVLVANPAFAGLPDYPAAQSAKTVIMQYTSSISTAWLEFSSGQAQDVQGVLPEYWNSTLALVKQGKAITSSFPTLSIYFYNYNINIDTTLLKTVDKNANVPSSFFINQDVRKAFAYAYNYSYYFSDQIGNTIYNASFQVPYAGMLVPGLPDSQNISQLNAVGAQVPYTNLVKAAQYWGDFWNSSARTAMGLSGTASNPTYKGSALDVPIFVLQSDPPDEAGATTWVQMLQKFIPGLDNGAQDVIQTSEVNIFLTWAVPQGDPMPISWGGWAPDYPYPTDYLSAMFLPSTTSTYGNANSWNSSYVAGVTTTTYGSNSMADPAEASALNNITIAYYRGVANETNPTQAAYWFQKMNELSVNMTMEVYLGQVNQIWIWDSIANKTALQQWQQNVMLGGGAEIMYNYVVYNSS